MNEPQGPDGGSAPNLPPPTVGPSLPPSRTPVSLPVSLPGTGDPIAEQGPSRAGSLTSFDATRTATGQLREAANRRRRRNRVVSRAVLLLFVAAVGAAGYFGYRAYQDDQDRQAADRREREASGELDDFDGAGASPLGNLAEVIEAQDTLNQMSVGPSGQLGNQLAQDAQNAVDGVNGTETPPPVSVATATVNQRAVDLPDTDAVSFAQVVYDATGTRTQLAVTYDLTTDQYTMTIDYPGQERASRYLVVSNEWVTEIGPDGSMQRWSRSTTSADPAPDHPLARLVSINEALPGVFSQYASPAEVTVSPEELGADAIEGYFLDLASFRAQGDEQYARWVSTWTGLGLSGPDLADDGTREIRAADERYIPPAVEPYDPGLDLGLTAEPRVIVATADGDVATVVVIISPDVSVAYALETYGTPRPLPELPADGWLPG